jgi:carboxyl-terminal processing protease
MRSKVVLTIVSICVALVLLTGAFSGGILVGRFFIPQNQQTSLLPIPSTQASPTPQALQDLFKPFWQSWQIVHDQYVDQPVNDEKLMQGAIQGMLASLGDQHTSYMNPDQYQQSTIAMQGEYDGIGAWVDTTGKYLTIVSPMQNSPAEKAGLKPGDQVIAVDGQDMTGIDGSLVIRKVLGSAGTNVTLTIQRSGLADPFDVTLNRAHIVIPSVESKMLDNNIAYIQLFDFGDKSTQEFHDALKDLMAKKPAGLILDLRNNGGGLRDAAIQIASEFIGEGVIMYEQYGDGTRNTYNAIPGGIATQIPMVVLINEGSASASEIVAGAIQDHGRGKLVGVTSYGKGSVQNWIPLDNNEGAVRVTVARWLTPNGRTIHEIGLTPDVEVKITADDVTNGSDPQLAKAVELLLTQ